MTMQIKRFSILLSILVAATFIISCEEPPPVVNKTPDKIEKHSYVLNPQDTISLNKFNTWTTNWKDHGKDFIANEKDILKYFTMPLIDVSQMLGETPDSARYYLGLRTDTVPNVPHLLLVGVDSNGVNLLDYSKGQYAYDVTKPCPPACSGGNY